MGFSNSMAMESIWDSISRFVERRYRAECALALVEAAADYLDFDAASECYFVEEYLEWDDNEGWVIKKE